MWLGTVCSGFLVGELLKDDRDLGWQAEFVQRAVRGRSLGDQAPKYHVKAINVVFGMSHHYGYEVRRLGRPCAKASHTTSAGIYAGSTSATMEGG